MRGMVAKQNKQPIHLHRPKLPHHLIPRETDGQYLLKLVLVVLLGTVWLKFANPITVVGIPLTGIPVGLFLGLILVNRYEKLQSDRKIWYVVLIIVTILSYFIPAGIVL